MGDRLATTDIGRKVGATVPLLGGKEKAGNRSNCGAQALTWNGPS